MCSVALFYMLEGGAKLCDKSKGGEVVESSERGYVMWGIESRGSLMSISHT